MFAHWPSEPSFESVPPPWTGQTKRAGSKEGLILTRGSRAAAGSDFAPKIALANWLEALVGLLRLSTRPTNKRSMASISPSVLLIAHRLRHLACRNRSIGRPEVDQSSANGAEGPDGKAFERRRTSWASAGPRRAVWHCHGLPMMG